MKSLALACMALFAAAGASASIPPAYRSHLPPVTRAGDIAFVSGGRDVEEEASIKRAAQEYPLELVFEEKDRPFDRDFIENVPVTIRDAKGDVVLQARSTGPILLARIPPGHYTVEAKWDAWTFSKAITIEPNDRERVVFSWWRGASPPRVASSAPGPAVRP
jgi:hypothetical protein